jgi:hypothetical protein
MVENSREKIEKRLLSFSYWLYDEKGLGLQKMIGTMLEPFKTNIPDKDINKFVIGAEILKLNGNISITNYNNFVKSLSEKKLVHTNNNGEIDPDGSWDYVNKLNTSYYGLSELLTEMFIRSYNSGSTLGEIIINVLISNLSDSEIKKVLLKHKHKLPQLFGTYLKSPHELLKFTNKIKIASSYGEKLENQIIDKLKNLGYEILYHGANGDFVDMIFSVDFIIKGNGKVYTVQVKTNRKQVEKFIVDCSNGMNKSVDILIYPENDKYKIFMVKDKVTKEINK